MTHSTLLHCIRYAARLETLPNWSAAEYVCGWAGWGYDVTLIFRIRQIIRHEKIKNGWRMEGSKYQYPQPKTT